MFIAGLLYCIMFKVFSSSSTSHKHSALKAAQPTRNNNTEQTTQLESI